MLSLTLICLPAFVNLGLVSEAYHLSLPTFLWRHWKRALELALLKSTGYQRYMDDTLLVWMHGQETLQGFVSP